MNKQQAKVYAEASLATVVGRDMTDMQNITLFIQLFSKVCRELNSKGFYVHSDFNPNMGLKGAVLGVGGEIIMDYELFT